MCSKVSLHSPDGGVTVVLSAKRLELGDRYSLEIIVGPEEPVVALFDSNWGFGPQAYVTLEDLVDGWIEWYIDEDKSYIPDALEIKQLREISEKLRELAGKIDSALASAGIE